MQLSCNAYSYGEVWLHTYKEFMQQIFLRIAFRLSTISQFHIQHLFGKKCHQ